MKLSSCLKWALFLIYSASAYAQSVRNEQVIRFENANDHAVGVSVSASPWTSADMKVVFPAEIPQAGQILKVDSVTGSKIVLSWASERPDSISMMRAYYMGTETVPYGSWSKISFNTESYDLNGEYDESSSKKFKAKAEGYYQVLARVELGQVDYVTHNITASLTVGIYKNGSLLTRGNTFPTTLVTMSNNVLRGEIGALVADVAHLNAGDEIEIYVYYQAPNNHPRDLIQGEGRTFLSIYKIK